MTVKVARQVAASVYSALVPLPANISIPAKRASARSLTVNAMHSREGKLAIKASASSFLTWTSKLVWRTLQVHELIISKRPVHPSTRWRLKRMNKRKMHYIICLCKNSFSWTVLTSNSHDRTDWERVMAAGRRPTSRTARRLCQPNRSDYWYSDLIESENWGERSKPADDACWWLVVSAGDVKTAVTIAVHQTTKEIIIETWELVARLTIQEKSERLPDVTQRIVVSVIECRQGDSREERPIDCTIRTFLPSQRGCGWKRHSLGECLSDDCGELGVGSRFERLWYSLLRSLTERC